ncbi:hypothetical protein [Oligosphaera ethanolica]|uniref:Uncharacterized protein n=1 Tax=Oligosphaera ethanolica TaxID=760260 RepID=A0AAE3VEJ7_9BACT|nr:hypothetical protein [Oligosphaera ethanolica]MDQ0289040.1 hypothetical protein [Oligosphaera ethanolica]
MKQQVPWIPLNDEQRFHRSNHPGGENTGDKLPETHGQSPPSHYPWVANQAADFIGAMLFT